MRLLNEIRTLIRKELWLEWKQRYAFNGLLLYVVSMVVVIAIAQEVGSSTDAQTNTWNILYWLIVMFVAINAVAKSFMGERQGQLLYLYSVASPTAIILAKIFYNSLLLIVISSISFFFHLLLGQTHVGNIPLYLSCVALGGIAFSANLTLISAIAARSENKTTLLAVLSFPLLVPVLLMLIRVSQKAIMGLSFESASNGLSFIVGLSVILILVSILLFPFLWRE